VFKQRGCIAMAIRMIRSRDFQTSLRKSTLPNCQVFRHRLGYRRKGFCISSSDTWNAPRNRY
jgi:hypothetical protein